MFTSLISVLVIITLSADGANVEKGPPGVDRYGLIDVESNLEPSELFAQWTKRYGKNYGGLGKYMSRFKVFQANMKNIKELNKKYGGGGKVQFGLTKFADLTTDEFRSQILMKGLPVEETKSTIQTRSTISAAMNVTSNDVKRAAGDYVFDWVETNSVPPVKNQLKDGTCYIFAALTVIEHRWRMKGNRRVSLSVEQVADCLAVATEPNNLACGVRGGFAEAVYRYIQDIGGIASEEAYPYCAGSGQCKPCAPEGYNSFLCGPYPIQDCKVEDSCNAKYNTSKFVEGLKLKSWSYETNSEPELTGVLFKKGPLSADLDARDLQFYSGGILMPIHCREITTHAVVLVGYGRKDGTEYWKAQNSWGTDFGEDGYFRIVRNQGACAINIRVTSVELE